MINPTNDLPVNRLRAYLKLRYLLFALAVGVEALGLWPLVTQVHVAEYDEAIFLDVAQAIHTTGAPVRSSGANSSYYFDHTPLYIYTLSPITGTADERVVIDSLANISICAGLRLVGFSVRRAAEEYVGWIRGGCVNSGQFIFSTLFLLHYDGSPHGLPAALVVLFPNPQ